MVWINIIIICNCRWLIIIYRYFYTSIYTFLQICWNTRSVYLQNGRLLFYYWILWEIAVCQFFQYKENLIINSCKLHDRNKFCTQKRSSYFSDIFSIKLSFTIFSTLTIHSTFYFSPFLSEIVVVVNWSPLFSNCLMNIAEIK